MHLHRGSFELCRVSAERTTTAGSQLLLYQLQLGLAAMATLAAPLFSGAAG